MSSYQDYRRDEPGRRPNGGAGSSAEMESRRERALERLTQAFSSDQVSMEDFEARAAALQKARDPSELEALIADLPQEAPRSELAGADSRPETRRPSGRSRSPASVERSAHELSNRVDPGLSGTQNLACVMGDRQLSGDWLNGDKVDSFTLMGSTKIDLRDVVLPEGRLRIEAFALMGETKIIVPRGLPVKLSVFPFMGEARAGRDVDQRIKPGFPYVEVSGMALMASIVVVAQD